MIVVYVCGKCGARASQSAGAALLEKRGWREVKTPHDCPDCDCTLVLCPTCAPAVVVAKAFAAKASR